MSDKKAVLISIQPKWCEKIANGEKTIEVRKTRPKLETPFKVYIYCTNNKSQYLRKLGTSCREIFITESKDILGKTDKVKSIIGDTTTFWENGGYNGKVIGEFICDRIDKFAGRWFGDYTRPFGTEAKILRESCLTLDELTRWLHGRRRMGRTKGFKRKKDNGGKTKWISKKIISFILAARL